MIDPMKIADKIWGIIVCIAIGTLLILFVRGLAHGADLTVKTGDVIVSSSKFPTTVVKVDTKTITVTSMAILSAIKGGFVFVRVLTNVPIMDNVQIDSLVSISTRIDELTGKSVMDSQYVSVSHKVPAKTIIPGKVTIGKLGETVIAKPDTIWAFYWRPYQCSWVEYKLDKLGNKVVRLIDIDGSEITLPIAKILGVWK